MRSLRTELNDRVLRYDGVMILEPDEIARALIKGVKPHEIRYRRISEEIELFNQNVTEAESLKPEAQEPVSVDMGWRLPEKYKNLDIERFAEIMFEAKLGELPYTDDQYEEACVRIADELQEIERRGMTEFIRTIVYILDVFREQNVVWGVGRGSSCACYILFILGLHSVDCVRYKIPMEEFFHD